jgi:tetrahydromethanopterin S-methyltransferase subunit C
VVVSVTVLVAVPALAIGQARRRPYPAVGGRWYLGTLVPDIGLVQVGSRAMAGVAGLWLLSPDI